MSSVAVLLSLGGLPPSSADTPGCVSRHEYDRVAKGMSMTKVHAIFDTEGAETNLGGGSGELRYYDTCTGRGAIQVGYNGRDRVTGKNGRFF
ncbi:hypothetical protein [Nocardioides alpinus]|nr:hypothetical protein [Nocardioides alpinus]